VEIEDREEVLRYQALHVPLGLDSLFLKTPIITRSKKAIQPGEAFEDTAFKPRRSEIVQF
jgi:hypothetical protein